MSLIKIKIESAYKNNELVCICFNKIKWQNRIIGYVKNINSPNEFELEVIDEFGQSKNIQPILFSSIKSLEMGGNYNERLDYLYKSGFSKKRSRV